MNLLFFCPRWGAEQLSWDAFCEKVKKAGYDGIEAGVSFDENVSKEMGEALKKYDLLLIGQYWQSFEKDLNAHKISYQKHLENLALLNPIKIDSQTGKDYFTFEQNAELFSLADGFAKRTGIQIAHETHRNKALFACHITRQFLERFPELKITADFSHWCTVAESFLEDQEEAISLSIPHAIHIHARVGQPQAPQVIDPRSPASQNALAIHTNWWKRIYQHHQQNGAKELTITTEFGPPPYLPQAANGETLADQWDINVWMMEYLRKILQK
jgi:hypothetical protein